VSTDDFQENLAYDVVDWYCCALKTDNKKHLHKAAYDWANTVCESSYVDYLQKKDVDELSAPEASVLHYCPQIEGENWMWHAWTWTDLWSVVTLGLSDSNESPYLSCPKNSKTGTDKVSFIITRFQEDINPHVYVKYNGELFGWSPVDIATDDFSSVTGGAGTFHVTDADSESFKDAFEVEIGNFDVSSMMKKRKQIAKKGYYSLIEENCAHVGLELLAAGLGCQANKVPFFTPPVMHSVLVNLNKQNDEEGLTGRLRKVNRALRQALNIWIN